MIFLLQPVDFRSDNNAQKAPILLCKEKLKLNALVNQDTINQPAFNELFYGVPIRGYGVANGNKSDLAFINRFYRFF